MVYCYCCAFDTGFDCCLNLIVGLFACALIYVSFDCMFVWFVAMLLGLGVLVCLFCVL